MDAETPAAPTAAAPATEPTPPTYVFPALTPNDFGGHHLDNESKVLWLGIRLESMDYIGALAFLRTFEHILWQIYSEMSRQARLRQQLAAPPAANPIPAKPIPKKKSGMLDILRRNQ